MLEQNISNIAQDSSEEWSKQDTIWMLSIYGTAIGAGTLFLPINAGLGGIWPLLIMLALAYPMTYFSHRALCRFVLSGSTNNDITEVMSEHFGIRAGKIFTILYFLTIYPILLLYSVAITNTAQSFLVNQMHITAPPRALLAIFLILSLMTIIAYGQKVMLKLMSMLVYPFITMLLLLSLYLIPHWNGAILQSNTILNGNGLLMTIWLIIPVMVFSFNHTPIISSFAVHQKENFPASAEKKCISILKYSHIIMILTVMFFVLSCVFSLSPDDLLQAKQQNISILSYIANHFQAPILAAVAPIIAFIAIAKSFLGHYLGAREGLQSIMATHFRYKGKTISAKNINFLIVLFMIMSCSVIATLNPSILGMIEMMNGPIIAIFLFLMPIYAINKIPALQKYRSQKISNGFIFVMGIIAMSAILYGLVKALI